MCDCSNCIVSEDWERIKVLNTAIQVAAGVIIIVAGVLFPTEWLLEKEYCSRDVCVASYRCQVPGASEKLPCGWYMNL